MIAPLVKGLPERLLQGLPVRKSNVSAIRLSISHDAILDSVFLQRDYRVPFGSPTVYLCSLLLFPREGDMSVRDYKTHYYANHRAFFTVFAFLLPADVVDTLLKGILHFGTQGPQYVASSVVLFPATAAGAVTRNETHHKLFAICCLCRIVWISFAIFHTLR